MAVLFIEPQKITSDVDDYLTSINVSIRAYNDIWTFLRGKSWGAGKVSVIHLTFITR